MGDADTLTMATAHDLFLLLMYGGRECDLAQFGRLASKAELHLSAARALPPGSWLLELRTPAEREGTR